MVQFEGSWADAEKEDVSVTLGSRVASAQKWAPGRFAIVEGIGNSPRRIGVGTTAEEAVADFWFGNHKMVNIDPKKLNHTFSRHALDFGILGPWNKVNAALLEQAIQNHVAHPTLQMILGRFRGTIPVTHYFDAATDLWVAVDTSNNFI